MIPEFSLQVTHKGTMTLDEEGSEATAATSIQLTPRPQPDLAPPTPLAPGFSRPFLAMTFHAETGSMLFLGKAVTPGVELCARWATQSKQERRHTDWETESSLKTPGDIMPCLRRSLFVWK